MSNSEKSVLNFLEEQCLTNLRNFNRLFSSDVPELWYFDPEFFNSRSKS